MDYFDSSVLIAAISEDDIDHAFAGAAWDESDGRVLYAHGILETFAILTGTRHPASLTPNEANTVIGEYVQSAETLQFSPKQLLRLLEKAQRLGVRGGAVYDYMHVSAARECNAARIFTLNRRHFVAIAPDLADRIFHPGGI